MEIYIDVSEKKIHSSLSLKVEYNNAKGDWDWAVTIIAFIWI